MDALTQRTYKLTHIPKFAILTLARALHPSHSLPTVLGRLLHNYHLDPEGPFACRLHPTISPDHKSTLASPYRRQSSLRMIWELAC